MAGYRLDLGQIEDSSSEYRTHFIDNLRATLTVLLIIQHSIMETASASYPDFDSLPLTIFVFMAKTVVVGLFFFVSGYAASISRTSSTSSSSYYHETGRSDAEFIWRRSVRLLLPGVVYGVLGHVVLWMVLSKSWPSFFGGAGDGGAYNLHSTGFARFEGPVVHILFLYGLDMAYVVLRPAKKRKKSGVISGEISLSPSPGSSKRGYVLSLKPKLRPNRKRRYRLVKVKSKRDWYTLVGISLSLLVLWTVVVIATRQSSYYPLQLGFSLASYDAIGPAAPFQYVLAYMAGTQLNRWKKHMLVPQPCAIPTFVLALASSVSLLLVGMYTSPSLRQIVDSFDISVHPSFMDGGFIYHTVYFAVWNALSFFGVGITLVSVYANTEWMREEWGEVARHTYGPAWVHMVPVVVFVKLLAAGSSEVLGPLTSSGNGGVGGIALDLMEEGSLGWRCFLVATGSVICSWFVGLAGAGVVWMVGC